MRCCCPDGPGLDSSTDSACRLWHSDPVLEDINFKRKRDLLEFWPRSLTLDGSELMAVANTCEPMALCLQVPGVQQQSWVPSASTLA